MSEFKTIQDVLRFLHEAIDEETCGKAPTDIAWDITDLMGLPVIDTLQIQYPALEAILNASADLEVTEKVGYEPVDILWSRIKRLTNELDEQVRGQ